VPGNGSTEWVVVHELAHMWWGDAVTVSDWDHVWLSEGFASYAEAQWYESSGGASTLQTYMQTMTGPFAGTIVDPPYVWDPIVYDKGAWILHMLRHIMGTFRSRTCSATTRRLTSTGTRSPPTS